MRRPGTDLELARTPERVEIEAKLDELAALQRRLAELEAELADEKAELAAFEIAHRQATAASRAALDDLQVLWKKRFGPPPPPPPDPRIAPAADADVEDVQAVYRRLVRSAHPDLAVEGDERERRHAFMIEVNRAYQTGDTDALNRLAEAWASDPDAVSGDDPAAELLRVMRRVAQVQRRIDEVTAELEECRDGETALLRRRVLAGVVEGRDVFLEINADLDAQASILRKQLARDAARRLVR